VGHVGQVRRWVKWGGGSGKKWVHGPNELVR
jgi:hypothetical protein